MALVFGAIGATNVAEGSYGFLTNFASAFSADEVVVQDEDGDVGVQNFFNEVTEITADYTYDSAISLPAIGATITIGATDKYAVTAVSETETNTDYSKASITFKKYTGNAGGIPAN